MKQKLFSLLSFADMILIFVCALVLVSCSEEEPAMFTTERIVINCTDSVTDASNSSGSRTRSVSESTKIGSSVLTSKTGKKMYLSCTEAPWPVEKTTVTRGGRVTTATIGTIGISASVYPVANSYVSAGCGSYFYKEAVTSGAPTNYYWPTSDYRISFFGYSPYNNAAFAMITAADATGAPRYGYTVPSTISNQLDIMTGQDVDHLGGSSSPVNMTLAHRCSAIHFSITNDRSDAITVNSISIEGVQFEGILSGSTWTLVSGTNRPFTLTYGSSVAAGATVDITGTSNIFMMLPQALPAVAKLKVVVDDEEFETDLTGTWVAGKEYTYTISMSESCIDLSMVDNAGNKRASMTTANCYLVHAAGDYKLPLVYGNVIKNGAPNTVAFNPGGSASSTYTTQFVNHDGTGISGPWITKSTSGTGVNKGMGLTAASAELLWQDISGLITSVSVSDNYLKFTVGTYAGGNALIAVKDDSGTILWSWHIWATDETFTSTTAVNTDSHTYNIAAVNLGWVPTGGSGKQGYCPYYQWGRKDPFIPCNGTTSGDTNKTIYNISGANITPASITESSTGIQKESSSSATIATNIQNPIKHYFNSSNYGPCNTTYYNMWDAQNTATNNVTSATKKTIYDPCPPGFCVPTGNLYCYMGNGLSNPTSIYFPAAGYRRYSSGSLANVGSLGYYWSASPYSANYGSFLNVDSGYWYWNYTSRAYGFSVRPVAEE